jgi:hypothetical protein
VNGLPLFSWRPPEKLVIFPSVRNRARIQRTAVAAAASKNPENTIRATVDRVRVRATYQRKGMPADLVARDIAQLDQAIREQVAALLRRQGIAK